MKRTRKCCNKKSIEIFQATGVSACSVMAPASRDDPPANQRAENALDALLDELQTFARPPGLPQSPTTTRPPSISEIGRRKGSIDSNNSPLAAALPPATSSLRRLHSYPSSSDDSSPPVQSRDLQKPATGPKPPVPERNAELLSQLVNRRVPPPPPPRTSSRSPLASPTSPSLPPRATPPCQPQMGINTGTLRRNASGRSSLRERIKGGETQQSNEETETTAQPSLEATTSTSNSSSCESVSSQEGVKSKESRKEQLEQVNKVVIRQGIDSSSLWSTFFNDDNLIFFFPFTETPRTVEKTKSSSGAIRETAATPKGSDGSLDSNPRLDA